MTPLLGVGSVRQFDAFLDKVNATDVVAVGVTLDGVDGGLELLVGDCHLLDDVPAPALLHLDDLPVS